MSSAKMPPAGFCVSRHISHFKERFWCGNRGTFIALGVGSSSFSEGQVANDWCKFCNASKVTETASLFWAAV